MNIGYVRLCQAIAAAKKDLVVGYIVYLVCEVIPSSGRDKNGTAGGL